MNGCNPILKLSPQLRYYNPTRAHPSKIYTYPTFNQIHPWLTCSVHVHVIQQIPSMWATPTSTHATNLINPTCPWSSTHRLLFHKKANISVYYIPHTIFIILYTILLYYICCSIAAKSPTTNKYSSELSLQAIHLPAQTASGFHGALLSL